MSHVLVAAISVISTVGIIKFIENIKFSALLYYIVEKRIHRTNKRRDGTVYRYCIKENCRRMV